MLLGSGVPFAGEAGLGLLLARARSVLRGGWATADCILQQSPCWERRGRVGKWCRRWESDYLCESGGQGREGTASSLPPSVRCRPPPHCDVPAELTPTVRISDAQSQQLGVLIPNKAKASLEAAVVNKLLKG